MKQRYTAVIEKHGRWFIAYVRELRGVNTQGRTKREARRNVREALSIILQVNRELGESKPPPLSK